MLTPSLCRDADGIKQACDAGCILKIRIIRKDVKEPFSGHSAALGIGDGRMRIVDVEDSHTSPRIDDHRRLGRGLRQALKKAPIRSEEHTSELQSLMRIS